MLRLLLVVSLCHGRIESALREFRESAREQDPIRIVRCTVASNYGGPSAKSSAKQ